MSRGALYCDTESYIDFFCVRAGSAGYLDTLYVNSARRRNERDIAIAV